MRQVLVLDQGYQPINAVPFSRAMLYVAKGKVDILADYDRLVHEDFFMPAVVRLRHNIKRHKQRIKFSRQNVLIRDKFKCQYCGVKQSPSQLTYDHVVPRAQGGITCWENIVMCCRECNSTKGARTPKEAGMKLLSIPARPTWMPAYNMALYKVSDVPDEWKDYWTAELVP